MHGVVEPARRVEGGAGRRLRVVGGEGAVGDTVGDDAGELVDERLDMCSDDLARVRGELDVGGEELGVVEGFPSLRTRLSSQRSRRWCRSLSGRDRFEGSEMLPSQRLVTASRSAALLGKWR